MYVATFHTLYLAVRQSLSLSSSSSLSSFSSSSSSHALIHCQTHPPNTTPTLKYLIAYFRCINSVIMSVNHAVHGGGATTETVT